MIPEDVPKKHRRLLESALELIRHRGYKSLTVEEIAAEAGISKVTLYKYYPSKEELFLYCVKILTDNHYKQIREILAGEKRAADKLTRLFQFNLEQRRQYSDAFLRDMMGTAHIWKKISPYRSRLARSLIGEILEEGVRNGEFRMRSMQYTIDLLISFSDVIASAYPYHNTQEGELFLENLYAFLKGALTCQDVRGGT